VLIEHKGRIGRRAFDKKMKEFRKKLNTFSFFGKNTE